MVRGAHGAFPHRGELFAQLRRALVGGEILNARAWRDMRGVRGVCWRGPFVIAVARFRLRPALLPFIFHYAATSSILSWHLSVASRCVLPSRVAPSISRRCSSVVRGAPPFQDGALPLRVGASFRHEEERSFVTGRRPFPACDDAFKWHKIADIDPCEGCAQANGRIRSLKPRIRSSQCGCSGACGSISAILRQNECLRSAIG